MSDKNIALYTKYRPQKFKDMLGQDHITDVLEEALKLGNIAHAYLFYGTRGTGKTTAARILAREIGTSNDDLYEIDAASNTGVDDIRGLNESVNVLPFNSKYKVYILDEVHMLSKSAFNALLKTLEEPPSHVIFILATTEMQKIPETVISRCETYTFKKPSQKILKEMIKKTAKEEGFSLEPSAADLMALLGDGSFRDAHGILQKIVSVSKDKKVSVEEVEKVTGAPKSQLVNDYVSALTLGDLDKGLGAVSKAAEANIDMKIFLELILMKVRTLLLLKFSKNKEKQISETLSEEDFEWLKKIAEKKETKIDSEVLLELLRAHDMVGRSAIPQLPLELALVNVINKQ
jgi:DNA polymerase III subunit gamma/tau